MDICPECYGDERLVGDFKTGIKFVCEDCGHVTPCNPIVQINELYILGVFDEEGNLYTFASSGRPSTIRVYNSLKECRNGLRALKRSYSGTLKPIRLKDGTVIVDDNA
ncbi:TFIIB-type zinc ribbon-containing protein [Paenibacillus alvei]|uniref:TFIIB-type zinc ribbon-containing protein n=1 Tax=Paenibacillus alvei TaxID=44250 RepID=UPI0002880DE9|nr:TFIIB-type zinc ribbon-containing protein [Paenibacillus alvei]EJW14830.1 hypothetical protein PAV_11c01710 [Paenibacillus alvei DSM 29]MCY9543696.1 TFIIB-type zinc ribbon-containing protein [Paenibacillus alvei]MCY9708534.1 TFIIB-type zinc ribbon-containing protein [Paenibacillus alvei]MEC0083235.1 TFIIB-type zinc ribbon-containing protein [Paenibacillus alvei]